ncbi:MAG: tRNA preQ1(34) S-adenosylmethionine ribosyltransferase-isomerase QueA [Candidatus Saccharibacteria bacterium]|nr:tRNA preQ1(34) S-adenosylmethionine ribosyltransferase-isomerase QueA [Candidatus Saccharibacteria bacterium]
MLVSDYSYELPEDRIAKYPPKERGSTRLLVLNREDGIVKDSFYRDLADFLNPGDVLILNDTRVMQSRLFMTLPDGRERELIVLEKHASNSQRVMYRGKLHVGDILKLNPLKIKHNSPFNREEEKDNDGLENHVEELESHVNDPHSRHKEATQEALAHDSYERAADTPRLGTDRTRTNYATEAAQDVEVKVTKILGNGIAEVESGVDLVELAESFGTVPLPPYLHRDAEISDQLRYQTVWAKSLGSAAAPTASLNMTAELLDKLKQKGVVIKYLTLHVGLGTFLPIRSDEVEGHKMHSEWFNIPDDTIDAIKAAKQTGARVVALGTTVARTLEYYAKTNQTSGEDDIFIYPGFEFRLIDALLTNFHAPKSTVLMLAAAFAGWENLKMAYDHAIQNGYNFLSYGDSMLIC